MNVKNPMIKKLIQTILRVGVVRILIVTLIGVATAMACSWSYITDHSVRFNSYRSGRGFYRLPPLPIMYDRKTGKELSVQDLNPENADANQREDDSLTPLTDELWAQAKSAVESNRLAEARSLFQKYLTLTAQRTIDEDTDRQQRRNSAYDMLDALTALQKGSRASSVKAYLDARYAYDDSFDQTAEAFIAKHRSDRDLQDNWDYLRAAILYSKQMKNDALKAFQAHAAKYPRSEKNEAVLFMTAKIMMETSYVFDHNGCGVVGKTFNGKTIDSETIDPTDKCQDENWHAAINSFQRLIKKYPHGRYLNDARGWLAFLYRRGGDRVLALAEYYRLLGDPTDRNARLEAKKSLQMIGHEYDDETLDHVEKLISGDVHTAMAYAYHRIYNHAVDLTYQHIESWYHSDYKYESEEKTRIADANKAGNHELNRIARFAAAMMKRYPQAYVSGGFVLRVAEAQIELQNYPEAGKLAGKALMLGLNGDLRAQALWIKGSTEHQAKDFKAARATFNHLISEFPNEKLTEGARRLLALTAEDQGNLEKALEQYLALHYNYDVAYFVDVLLPTERLEKFAAAHEHIEQNNELLYALGIRYMRDKRWNEARSTFRRVQTKYAPPVTDSSDAGNIERRYFSKEPDWDWNEGSGIKSSWVMQDLKTIDVLEHLEQIVESAQGDEAKSEAMYQLASYQFDANSLLFYNPAAWRGQRVQLLSQLDISDSLRLPNESQVILDYSQLHETLARAIPIYQEIVDRYPQTKASKDAIFSAAVAHQRLANLNPYWREIYARGLFAGSQMVEFAGISRIYPHFRWPKSRDGWEASTRTVRGGPAYPLPPKPAPKLTLTQRIKRKLGGLASEFSSKIQQKINTVSETSASFLRNNLYLILVGLGLFAFWKYRRLR